MSNDLLNKFINEINEELTANILPFWMNKMVDNERGGFYGQITGNDELKADASKGAILNARILWTFSAAYRITQNSEYLKIASRAKEYFVNNFIDDEFGGVYWSLDYNGKPLDTKKQIYAIGFAIYGLSEYFRATSDQEALESAKKLFYDIESHAFDTEYGGYFEALSCEWLEIGDMRLSEKDANERKTMNTHLHILEPYTNLFRIWKNPLLKTQIEGLLTIFTDRILDKKTGHLQLFFTDDWQVRGDITSYGHDIEASWLMYEAALELENEELLLQIKPIVQKIAEAAAQGLQEDGSFIYEKNNSTGHTDLDRHWWVQAEAVVGYFNLFQRFGDTNALQKAQNCFLYIQQNVIDTLEGEWFWSIDSNGSINRKDDKAGFWKCPYHNARMCLELMERVLHKGEISL